MGAPRPLINNDFWVSFFIRKVAEAPLLGSISMPKISSSAKNTMALPKNHALNQISVFRNEAESSKNKSKKLKKKLKNKIEGSVDVEKVANRPISKAKAPAVVQNTPRDIDDLFAKAKHANPVDKAKNKEKKKTASEKTKINSNANGDEDEDEDEVDDESSVSDQDDGGWQSDSDGGENDDEAPAWQKAAIPGDFSYGLIKQNGKSSNIINPEAPIERIDPGTGFPVYKAHLLKVGEGGGTPLCPFDCNCCF